MFLAAARQSIAFKDFEAGYAEFKIGLLLREAREQAGVTQEKLARITKTKKNQTLIQRLDFHVAGSVFPFAAASIGGSRNSTNN
jgi:hypothetical protein